MGNPPRSESMLRIELGVPGTYSCRPDAAALGLDPDLFADLRVEMRAEPSSCGVQVDVRVQAAASLICDRTLEEFSQPIDGSCFVLLLASPASDSAVVEDGHDELRYFGPHDKTFDVTAIVRDTLLLAVPVRKVSPAAKSIDIQTVFGGPGCGGDERWETLMTIRDNAFSY